MEERSKLNRQGSPKICTTVSDTAIQSRSDSISQSGVVQSAQTPPMQRPVEPQGGQGKVGVNKCLKVCLVKPPKYRREDTTACAFLPLIFKLLYPLLSMLPYSLLLFLFCPPTVSPFPLLPFQIAYNWGEKKPNKHHLGIQNNLAFFSTLACSSNCLAPSSFCSAAPPSWCAAAVLCSSRWLTWFH